MIENLKLDVGELIGRSRRKLAGRVGGVSINLPFVSFNVSAEDAEVAAAQEILIRLSDRRVLSARECCDNCIDDALVSLQEIREVLVEKQVQLAALSDGPVYLLTEFMLEPIRQFLTYEQRLRQIPPVLPADPSFRRNPMVRDAYFAGLETLRGHLHRCLLQLAKIAEIDTPKVLSTLEYSREWVLADYKEVGALPPGTV